MSKFPDILVLIVYLAALFTLVRPGSQGPSLIKVMGSTIANIIAAATGGGSWGTPASAGTSGAPQNSGTVFA